MRFGLSNYRTRYLWTRYKESTCHFQLQRKEFTNQERYQMQGEITIIENKPIGIYFNHPRLRIQIIMHQKDLLKLFNGKM